MKDFKIREALPEDAAEAAIYLQKLGSFMKVQATTTVTAEKLRSLLESGAGRGLWGIYQGKTVAFMYYYDNSASLRGETGIYIDSLYIEAPYRRCGIGREMIKHVAEEALEKGCKRLEWMCMDWNKEAIALYEKLGAVAFDTATTFRMSVDKIEALAKQ